MATLTDQPRDLLLGDDNDIVITNDAILSRGLTGVAQACRVAVQMFAEEWFLDLDVGIPYIQSILGQRATDARLIAQVEFRSELLAVAGVTGITSLNSTFDSTTRTLSVIWEVATNVGNTEPDTIVLSSSGGF